MPAESKTTGTHERFEIPPAGGNPFKNAVIGVVGLGYVGLPLVAALSRSRLQGHRLRHRREQGRALERAARPISSTSRPQSIAAGASTAASTRRPTFARPRDVDAMIICVPTPLDQHREPDLSLSSNTVEALVPHLRAGQVLSLESTTYPGTTDEELRPRIEKRGLQGRRGLLPRLFARARRPRQPEFHAPARFPKVCGGVTAACLEVGVALYGQVDRHRSCR